MKKDIKKWIWQHEDYPNFRYDKSAFEDIILKIEYNRGLLNGLVSFFDKDNLFFIKTNALLNEIINSYEIEGEILKRDSVRSSLMKRFDKNFDSSFDTSNHQSDALADILIDCATNKKPLSKSRLHGWHNVLFEHGYSGFEKINVAKFRTNDDMKVVSGAIGFEKTHYQAPPCKLIEKNMENFITYCNQTQENIYIKSSIAHLWFVIIHPYDDGNGRIARAITDYLLSNEEFKIYSVSQAINQDKKGYYALLDKTTNLFYNKNFDISSWIFWHLQTQLNALKLAKKSIDFIILKTKFWDKHKDKSLNPRQIKVLSKILSKEDFQGGLSTKKYISIAKTSKASASRDIKELLAHNCIKQIPNTNGRNVRYEVVLSQIL